MAHTHRGKVAIVTGAGRGLGRAMALGLIDAGASVIGVGTDASALDDLRKAAGTEAAQRLVTQQRDVTDEGNALDIVRGAVARFGKLDILINNAGVNLDTVVPGKRAEGRSWELEPAIFRRLFEVNAIAPFLMARAAIPEMQKRKQKWGRILGVTTSLDTMWRNIMIPYGSTKAAHECYVAALAEELEGTGITVNVLVPGGPSSTRMSEVWWGEKIALLIKPEIMVAPLLWLTTSEADGISGRRFIAARWDKSLPGAKAAEQCGAPAAWPQLGVQSILPALKAD
jgi:NAD(P)-dependent dehydrogenase (short-subunit alcohol dehydrogenase family)